MKKKPYESSCPICGARMKKGKVLYSVDLGFGIVVVRNVPARVCEQCGEEWISPEVARKLEEVTDQARKRRHQIEVVAL
jgi:YgiT-type zinc finger domain-containing protein